MTLEAWTMGSLWRRAHSGALYAPGLKKGTPHSQRAPVFPSSAIVFFYCLLVFSLVGRSLFLPCSLLSLLQERDVTLFLLVRGSRSGRKREQDGEGRWFRIDGAGSEKEKKKVEKKSTHSGFILSLSLSLFLHSFFSSSSSSISYFLLLNTPRIAATPLVTGELAAAEL
jgi:hypothetical protein